uniref:Uncharacterized protein n=1 Tax=Utricularia reniformis TaxID=192314 RepID=A0A1Y0B4L9_9LAMI|nr:hypothetical protein AEK19_MT2225 [Utricularia reniformis]ART32371.1 hypothetical protein AEK19_MT2225 [Utricularia reniformis]
MIIEIGFLTLLFYRTSSDEIENLRSDANNQSKERAFSLFDFSDRALIGDSL